MKKVWIGDSERGLMITYEGVLRSRCTIRVTGVIGDRSGMNVTIGDRFLLTSDEGVHDKTGARHFLAVRKEKLRLIKHAVFCKGALHAIMMTRGINLTAQMLSDCTGFPLAQAKGILNGTEGFDFISAQNLARIFGIPFDELFGGIFSR